jgi:flagellar assembly factor FliW
MADVVELHFAAGLPGFNEARRFELEPWGADDTPFSVLKCLDDPDLQFVVVPPEVFFPDYAIDLDGETAERIDLKNENDADTYVIITLGEQATDATANLLGPIVVNRRNHEAIQAVLASSGYELRTPLISR